MAALLPPPTTNAPSFMVKDDTYPTLSWGLSVYRDQQGQWQWHVEELPRPEVSNNHLLCTFTPHDELGFKSVLVLLHIPGIEPLSVEYTNTDDVRAVADAYMATMKRTLEMDRFEE